MVIPKDIKIRDNVLPAEPGVYIMRGARRKILYIGKATSLKARVSSYFTRPSDQRIAKMVSHVQEIDYEVTPTTIEALILEAKLIRKFQPPYNVREKDDKSFVYLVFTKGDFPQPVIIRGYELARVPKRQFGKVFGPFRSAGTLRAALDTLRRSFPWTTCRPDRKRPCFHRHLGLCPGVCTGDITKAEYRRIIDRLARFFEGRRDSVVREMERSMEAAAKAERYEEAADLRDRLYALEHVRDIAVLKREDAELDQFIDIFGRIEGYDVSNISGRSAVGAMAVFRDGEPRRSGYRRFIIRDVEGQNDVAMMEEILRRRFARSRGKGTADKSRWPLPDLILVDGGVGQMNAARRVLESCGLKIPVVGIAKGFDRKQDELIYDKSDAELARLVRAFKPLLQRLRDEAHRTAVSFHRFRRGREFLH